MTRQYYNPTYGHPDDNVENDEYWAWLEDHGVNFLFRGYKQVGYIDDESDGTLENPKKKQLLAAEKDKSPADVSAAKVKQIEPEGVRA
jgi:hypothetical protein